MADNETVIEAPPNSSFITYVAEGEQLYQKAEYLKAIECYNTALILQPSDKGCLVARAKCYLKLGDATSALSDAEAALKQDKSFFRGLYQKAEALYLMGDFEFALVYYHRGNKIRPELHQFRLGIQKAREAIINSVGSPESVTLQNTGNLLFVSKQEESKQAQMKIPVKPIKKDVKKDFRQLQLEKEELEKKEKKIRQLLGELYIDKAYLETLLNDEDLVKGNVRGGVRLKDLIMSGITYLDTRTNFWRQQKPIYARERDRKILEHKWIKEKKVRPADPTRYILKSLQEIDRMLTSGNPKASRKKALQVLKTVEGWTEDDVPNKQEIIGNLYSCIGNAQIEMGDMEAALESQKKDLMISTEYNLPEAKSRALDNIGRVYARIGQFQNAIDVWEEKIPMAKSSLEKTWLFHEIGRCYLELANSEVARDYGEKSMAAAEEAEDVEWQLNASVLVAQAEVQLKDFKSAVTNFEKSLERAKLLHNEAAEHAIKTALKEANKGIVQQLKASQQPEAKEAEKPDLVEADTTSSEEIVQETVTEPEAHEELKEPVEPKEEEPVEQQPEQPVE
ncbi:outer dynein arm-docking complex subunit 4 [Lissotriton helveticus]